MENICEITKNLAKALPRCSAVWLATMGKNSGVCKLQPANQLPAFVIKFNWNVAMPIYFIVSITTTVVQLFRDHPILRIKK